MARKPPSAFARTFGAPAVIAFISGVGLFAALLGDGLFDWASWIALAIPVAAIVWGRMAKGR